MTLTLKEIRQQIATPRELSFTFNRSGRRQWPSTVGLPAIDRFILKTVLDRKTSCWEWVGTTSKAGYGQFRFDGRKTSPHRFIWIYLYGEIPARLEIDHVCKNRRCANPKHLRTVTHKENQQGIIKPECPKGHPMSGDNLHITRTNRRVCKRCRNLAANEWLKRKEATDPEFKARRRRQQNESARRRSRISEQGIV